MIDNLINRTDKYSSDINRSPHSVEMLILERIKPGSIVLEFGPGHGKFTRYLQQEKHCKVYAVEINQQYAKEVSPFCEKIIHANIEHYTWLDEFKGVEFDYIIFADVLEHLYEPWKVLTTVKESSLSSHSRILISIPNIAHTSIILGLMNDEFNYSAEGLLDATHIRFFTKKTLDKMFDEYGFNVSYISANYVWPSCTEFQTNLNGYLVDVVNTIFSREYGNVYQFIYEIVDKNQQITAKVDLEEKFCVTVYYSYGGEFSQNNMLQYWAKDELLVDLSSLSKVNQLRVDFVEYSCLIELKQCYVRLANNLIEHLTPAYTNSSYCTGTKFWFINNSDPQVLFDIPADAVEFYINWQTHGLAVTNIGDVVQISNQNNDDDSRNCSLQMVALYENLHNDINRLNIALENQNNEINNQLRIIDANNYKIIAQTNEIQTKDNELNRLGLEIQTRDKELNRLGLEIQTRDNELNRLGLEIQTRDKELNRLGLEIQTRDKELNRLGLEIQTRDKELNRLSLEIQNKDNHIAELNSNIEDKNNQINQRMLDIVVIQNSTDSLKRMIIGRDNQISVLKKSFTYRVVAKFSKILGFKNKP